MRIAFYGDSLTAGIPGASTFRLLKSKLPEHTLLNYGRNDETALSLLQRIERTQPPYADLAFLWIGTNDVPVTSSTAQFLKRLQGRLWAPDILTFTEVYREVMNEVRHRADRVIAVTPALADELLDSERNQYMREIANAIREEAALYEDVTFLDLRSRFHAAMNGAEGREYVPFSTFSALWDAFTLRTAEKIDRASAQRGLQLTIDGIHLNNAGAALAAETFTEVIESH